MSLKNANRKQTKTLTVLLHLKNKKCFIIRAIEALVVLKSYSWRKWNLGLEFQFWIRLFVFHFSLMFLGKAGIHILSSQLWVNWRLFSLVIATDIKEEKLFAVEWLFQKQSVIRKTLVISKNSGLLLWPQRNVVVIGCAHYCSRQHATDCIGLHSTYNIDFLNSIYVKILTLFLHSEQDMTLGQYLRGVQLVLEGRVFTNSSGDLG